jgi:transcriptional regulator with XRE-family HTH domain
MGRAQAGEERIPARLARRLVEGEHPIRAWREHRGLTQAHLAERAGVGQSYVAMPEAGERKGAGTRLRAIARALGVELDDLADWGPMVALSLRNPLLRRQASWSTVRPRESRRGIMPRPRQGSD